MTRAGVWTGTWVALESGDEGSTGRDLERFGALLAEVQPEARLGPGRARHRRGARHAPHLLLDLATQGATSKAIQELPGNQDRSTTRRHMHPAPAHEDAASRLLDQRPVDEGGPLDSGPPLARYARGDRGLGATRAWSSGPGLRTLETWRRRPRPE